MQKVTINGRNFTVKELTMREVLDLFGPNPPESIGVELAKRAIFLDGAQAAIGDGFLDLPLTTGQKLISIVSKVNNLEDTDAEGNPGA